MVSPAVVEGVAGAAAGMCALVATYPLMTVRQGDGVGVGAHVDLKNDWLARGRRTRGKLRACVCVLHAMR